MPVPKTTRIRWCRFSLRSFFALLTIFGIWLGVQAKWIRDRHEWLKSNPQVLVDVNLFWREVSVEPVAAPWPLRILGERGRRMIYLGFPPADREKAKELFPEADVMAGGII